ncbi:MAG: rhodanese-related sulfurtransferase [Sphingobium sp.]|nr:rhodanese-related sulfurtransferase [Sphingobium sp.]
MPDAAPPAPAPFTIAALYRFAAFDAPEALAAELRALCAALGVMGTLILAREGINGTVAGDESGIATMIAHIRALPGCANLGVKYATAAAMPFVRMKVKVKPEIVTLGAGELNPAAQAGAYVDPADWNALIADPDTILIDTRNAYEVAVGSFKGAIDPGTESFREFPQWFDALADRMRAEGRKPKIAMYCTGGIRCEKSTALARTRGFNEVYHLKGGILRYLEEIGPRDSLWSGDCFVFDQRVAVGHGLAPGDHAMCRPCGRPYRIGDDHRCKETALAQGDGMA